MRLTTGITELDRRFSDVGEPGQGLPPGSIVAVQSPPEAQCDSLIAAGIDERETVYFTTVRSEAAIRESLDRVADDPDIGGIVDVTGEDATGRITDALADLGDGEDVIVEVVDVIEEAATTGEYVAFLDELTERLVETDSVALLHGLEDGHTPRNRRYTLEAAHFVWNLRTKREEGRTLTYTLSIPKARGVTLDEDDRLLEVDLGNDFYIDDTRNI